MLTSRNILPPPTPFQANTSSTEEHHLKNIILVCKLQRTLLITPPTRPPPFQTNTSSTEEHHLGLQATTNVNNPPHPPHPLPNKYIIHGRTSSEEHHLGLQATANVNTPPHPQPHPPIETGNHNVKKFKNAQKHTKTHGRIWDGCQLHHITLEDESNIFVLLHHLDLASKPLSAPSRHPGWTNSTPNDVPDGPKCQSHIWKLSEECCSFDTRSGSDST